MDDAESFILQATVAALNSEKYDDPTPVEYVADHVAYESSRTNEIEEISEGEAYRQIEERFEEVLEITRGRHGKFAGRIPFVALPSGVDEEELSSLEQGDAR